MSEIAMLHPVAQVAVVLGISAVVCMWLLMLMKS